MKSISKISCRNTNFSIKLPYNKPYKQSGISYKENNFNILDTLDLMAVNNKAITFTSKQEKDLADAISKLEEDKSYLQYLADDDKNNEFWAQAPNLHWCIFKKHYEIIRKTSLLNKKTGEYEEAYIIKNPNIDSISIHTKNEKLGYATFAKRGLGHVRPIYLKGASEEYQEGGFLEISLLDTQNAGLSASKYRGIGTELVKQAIIESYKRGYKGRIALFAYNKSGEGKSADGFYSHIGLQEHTDGDNNKYFSMPEDKMAEFLLKQ